MKEELKQLISSSDLSDEAKEMWTKILDFISDKEARAFTDFIGTDNNQGQRLEYLTVNIKLKSEAFVGKDQQKFNKIFKDEGESLSSYNHD